MPLNPSIAPKGGKKLGCVKGVFIEGRPQVLMWFPNPYKTKEDREAVRH